MSRARALGAQGMRLTTGELWRMGAMELAEVIRTRQASSQEVVEAHLRRIEEVNASTNAVVVVLQEQALEAARAADRAAAKDGDLPRLHGVPFTIKDNIDLTGIATTQGARALAHAVPSLDAPAVERLRAAGAIPLGRTNLPTFGIGWVCDSELWGPTVNPWDPALTPGASSGGEAAAIATGMSPLGLGNDGLGSLRWPAQCCGISALRPTLGRVPRATTLAPADAPISAQLMEVEGPMARTVADLRAGLEVVAGPSWRDPWSVPAPLHGSRPSQPIRVAVVADPVGQGVAAPVKDGVLSAARLLEDAGYCVEEAEPPIEAAAEAGLAMLAPDWQAASPFLSAAMGPEIRRVWAALLEVAGDPDRLAVMEAYMARHALLRDWAEFQETHPLILGPICTDTPFAAGKGTTTGEVREILHGLRLTTAVNALGLPAVALPVGSAGGLPQAVQVIGARFREDLCLDAATALENRVGPITPVTPTRAPARR